jgi:hypothetical protein
MTDVQLAWLSTIAWFVMTAALFIVLARWSAGEGSWGGLPGIVRGLRDWTISEHPRADTSNHASSSGSPRAEITEL